MGKAEAGSTKAIANAIKAKGLGRLRWYCQVCEKQCRDENGFQAHTRSEGHIRKMHLLGPKAGAVINDYSTNFQNEFITLLRTRHLTNRVQANKVYNEYIQDKDHIHMNATKWVTLGGFIATLGKAGLVKVDEDEKGLWIQWVDSRPETLARQAAIQKADRGRMDGEERERMALQEQIKRARLQEEERAEKEREAMGDPGGGLKREEGGKISLSFAPIQAGWKGEAKANGEPNASTGDSATATADKSNEGTSVIPPSDAPASSLAPPIIATTTSLGALSSSTASTSTSIGGIKPITNPLKRPASTNVFKSAKAPKLDNSRATDGDSIGGSGKKGYMSEAERLMKEDQARKAGRQGGSGSGSGGGYGGLGPVRSSKPVTGRYY